MKVLPRLQVSATTRSRKFGKEAGCGSPALLRYPEAGTPAIQIDIYIYTLHIYIHIYIYIYTGRHIYPYLCCSVYLSICLPVYLYDYLMTIYKYASIYHIYPFIYPSLNTMTSSSGSGGQPHHNRKLGQLRGRPPGAASGHLRQAPGALLLSLVACVAAKECVFNHNHIYRLSSLPSPPPPPP